MWLEFRAPEVHSADPLAELSYAHDVWALACLAYLLCVPLSTSLRVPTYQCIINIILLFLQADRSVRTNSFESRPGRKAAQI